MAIRKLEELTNNVVNIPQDVRFPKGRYTARCKKEEFTVSKSSGKPMVVRTWEIVLPENVQIGNVTYTVAGTEVTQYLIIKDPSDPSKSDKSLGRFMDDLKKLGCPNWNEVDDENPQLFAEGKVAQIIVDADEYSPMNTLTEEQKAAGEKPTPITMEDGTAIKRYRPVFKELLGLSSVSVGNTY